MIFGGKARSILSKIKNKIRVLSITISINVGLELPVTILRQWKEIGDVKNGNEMIKLSFFYRQHDCIPKKPTESTEKLRTTKILLCNRLQNECAESTSLHVYQQHPDRIYTEREDLINLET